MAVGGLRHRIRSPGVVESRVSDWNGRVSVIRENECGVDMNRLRALASVVDEYHYGFRSSMNPSTPLKNPK